MTTALSTMTARERIRATIDGEEVDRFPVWLKMANGTWKTGQPEEVRSMNSADLLRAAGCDVMVGNGQQPDKEHPHVTVTRTEEKGQVVIQYETPDGPLTEIYAQTHPIRHMVSSIEDLQKVRWLYRDSVYTMDLEKTAQTRSRQETCEADDIFTMEGTGPSPFMDLVEHVIGSVNTYYLLQDAPDLFEEVLELMHQDRLRMFRALLPHTYADTFWMSENTSTTLISPDIFRKYCMPYLHDYGNMIMELSNAVPVHHMCGTLNALLEDIDVLPAKVNEAYTTGPLGDVTLAEGRTRMPSKTLWGGTNATLWMEPADKIIQEVADDLANCPDRRKIMLTSAGVLPPAVSLEKARQVVEGLKRI